MPKEPLTTNNAPKKNFFARIPWRHPVTLAVLTLVLIFVIKAGSIAAFVMNMMANPRPAPLITTAIAKEETWPQTLNAVAQLKSQNGALLKAELAGTLKEIAVQAGQSVKKGDVLLVIDADAERAAAKLAELTLNRARELRAQSVNTQNDLDQAEANYANAMAALGKKEIRAPFDGEVGIPQVFLGQYVMVGMPLIAVESRQMINADFGVPQAQVPALVKGADVKLTVDAYPGEIFTGQIEGIDPRVDEATLTVNVRASFANKEGKLLSGMFGSVEVATREKYTGVAVPAAAVVYSAYGNAVYTVKEAADAKTGKTQMQAQQQFVKVLTTRGDWALVTGLKAGDEVVTAGHMKLQPGSPVRIDNAQSLPMELNPKVQES